MKQDFSLSTTQFNILIKNIIKSGKNSVPTGIALNSETSINAILFQMARQHFQSSENNHQRAILAMYEL